MSQSGSYSSGGGGGGGALNTLTGNVGGAVSPSGGGNINVVGAGSITVTGNPGTNTLTITDTGGGFQWNTATVNAIMLVDNGYITNGAGQVQLLLPMAAAVGSIIRVSGRAATGWQVTQNAGQTIYFGNMTTTTGAGGSLSSTATRDCVELLCVIANTDWNVLSAVGNLAVV